MRWILCFMAMAFVAIGAGCRRPSPRPEPEPLEPIAVRLLVEHLVTAKRVVASAPLGEETIWTDSAILERATQLPASLTAHLRQAPDAGPSREGMTAFLQRVESDLGSFQPATAARDGGACAFVGAGVQARVNCVYANYLEARYPNARFLVKGELEPVVLAEGRAVRGAVMPMKF